MNTSSVNPIKNQKPKVHVIGHRNPDTDAICSVTAYAYFKKRIDDTHYYEAAICGPANKQTRFVFERFQTELPEYLHDVYPRVEDIMETNPLVIRENDPLLSAIELFNSKRIRTIPVVNDSGQYSGLLSLLELSAFFIPKDFTRRPEYTFRPENWEHVLPGSFIKRGEKQEFTTRLMVGGMSYSTFLERIEQLVDMETENCAYPVLIVGNRQDVIKYAITHDFPAIILTGPREPWDIDVDISDYRGWIFISYTDTAETTRILQTSVPVKCIASNQAPVVTCHTKIREVTDLFKGIDYRGLAVVDENKLVGLINSSKLIDLPRRNVILIDHNENNQAVEGIEQANILEIIDHHRIGMERTNKPIYLYAKPIGSSCTLVYQHYMMAGVPIPESMAGLMLSGILSDTVILRSPTTTSEDVHAATELAGLLGINYETLGREIFSHASSLSNAVPEEVVVADFKIYTEFGVRVGISQVEVVTLSDVKDVLAKYQSALSSAAHEHHLDWMMLLITNIFTERSILLTTANKKLNGLLPFEEIDECEYDLPGILSRKKQLLPEILRILELQFRNKK